MQRAGDIVGTESALDVIGAALDVPEVPPALSIDTRITTSALLAAGEEVLLGAAGEALSSLGATVIGELASSLAVECVSALSDVVPIIGQAIGWIVDVSESAYAEQDQELEARQAAQRQKCAERARLWQPVIVGEALTPSDLFLRAWHDNQGWHVDEGGLVADERYWQRYNRARKPNTGQWFELVGEVSWPIDIVGRVSGWSMVHGYAVTPQAILGAFGFDAADVADLPPELPVLGPIGPMMGRLRRAMAMDHPYAAHVDGRATADGGRALWPLYADLLLMVTDNRRTNPWGNPTAHDSDEGAAPPLDVNAATMLYQGLLGWTPGDADALDAPLPQRIWKDLYGYHSGKRGVMLAAQCQGLRFAGLHQVYHTAAAWGRTAHPVHTTEQQEQAERERQSTIEMARQWARDELAGLGAGGGKRRLAKPEALRRLVSAGLLTDKKARAVSGEGGKAIAAAGGLGLLFALLR